MDKPLAGIRILDLTHVWAGPLGTRILGDLGAEVLKLEAATARGLRDIPVVQGGQYPGGDPGTEHWNRQGFFNKLNRNKRGICIDLKAAAGKRLFLALVAESDVVIENFSATAMNRLGLGYEAMREANPQIIYVAMPGFGTSGPYSDFVAFGPSVEPMSGLTALMGYNDKELRNTAMALPDAIAGVTAAAAVVTALAQRKASGEGQYVDLPLHEAAISLLGEKYIETQLTGKPPAVTGNQNRSFAPQGVYPCAGDNQWLAIACPDEATWSNFALFSGIDKAGFANMAARLRHQDQLDDAIAEFTVNRDKHELMVQLQQAGVPAGAVMTTPEFMADPQVTERDYFVELGGDHIETLPYPGSPVRFDGERATEWRRAPRLGEHNDEVLRQLLNLSDDEIQKLKDDGVIANAPPTVEQAGQR
ncbi:MAG: CoA transferase [Proteobacteria bacterium]|nr:CoA transferase [Pseudomonadota bacterium]